eukprot:Skav209232  [mRNA]  locus=scaffold293:315308:323742:- [translate_table: standard]
MGHELTKRNLGFNLSGRVIKRLKVFKKSKATQGGGGIAMVSTEKYVHFAFLFKGVLQENAWKKSAETHYKVMKEGVELLPVIQIGLAIGSRYGQCLGAWNFNLNFNLATDHHTDAQLAVKFLAACGVDFERHALEGVEPGCLGALLQCSATWSSLAAYLGCAGEMISCRWVTFAGMADLAYLMQLMQPTGLPETLSEFEVLLEDFCTGHQELRDWLPFGSLSTLAQRHGVIRCGQEHTAGSDAMVTLELFFQTETRAEDGETGARGDSTAADPRAEFDIASRAASHGTSHSGGG